MKVTAETFAPFHPCPRGVRVFRQAYPDGIPEWTRDAQLAGLLTECRRYLGWAWRVGALPMWSLAGANLYGADLRGAVVVDLESPKP